MNPEYDFDSCTKEELISIIDYLECKIERMYAQEENLEHQLRVLRAAYDA